MEKVKVTQVRSQIGTIPKHRKTLKALGLGRIGKERVHTKSPVLDGMIRQVGYLLKVEKV
ncbi:MAG: 50S ribosomal protein L30 [Leptospiraceae bacterium]|nr:50S ribosomal protein L30 [Leptospiraceae bacterium]MCP5511878.1 50S ribosomal protein L30 [Leptospiraceae bacterium]